MKNIPFYAIATKDGGFDVGSDYNRARVKQWLKDHAGTRLKFEAMTPESNKQRRFFEGAVVPLVAFYQEGMSHTNTDDLRKVREWLKIEFNGEFISIKGKSVKVAKSTKGELNRGFLERVQDWMEENGYAVEVLNPKEYEHWRDAIFPYSGPDNYIDYLVELKKLPNLWMKTEENQ